MPLLAPHNNTETSIAAAQSIAPILPKLEAEVLGLLTRCGSLTDEEMTNRLGWNPSTLRPRRRGLVQRGLVEDSGQLRPGISGRMMTCWRVVEMEPHDIDAGLDALCTKSPAIGSGKS